jgi:cobalt-zinc-cadmium efflux system outer membrane protein
MNCMTTGIPKRGRRLVLLAGLFALPTGCALEDFHRYGQDTRAPKIASAPVLVAADAQTSQSAKPTEASPPNDDPNAFAATYEPPGSERKGGPSKEKIDNNSSPARLALPMPSQNPIAGTPNQASAPFTFDQVIGATLTADPKIRAGFEAINQAQADLLTSSLLPNPSLLMDGIFLPTFRRFTLDKPGGPPQTDAQLSFPVDWFLFGKRVAAMASASLAVRQSEADYADLVRQRVRDVAVAFFDVAEAKAQLDLARQDVENFTKLEAATQKAVDAGGRPVVDLNRVRLDLLKSQQDLREAESTLTVSKAKLRAFFGQIEPAPNFDVVANLGVLPTVQPPPLEEAYALAQQNRPDIQSLRWQVAKAQADVESERRKGYPQVTPMVGYSRQFQTTALGVPDADSMTVSLTTTLPVFDRNQGNWAKAQSIAVQNQLNLRGGVVDLRAEVEEAFQDFKTAYENAGAVADEQLRRAADVRDSITKAYEAGGRTLTDVLDAQRSYRDTYRLYITNRANYWRSLYKFSAAVGKQVQSNEQR